jgi:hypothetical protein
VQDVQAGACVCQYLISIRSMQDGLDRSEAAEQCHFMRKPDQGEKLVPIII